jgi:putative FmdB family regulatory protein
MPIYTSKCTHCDEDFEYIRKIVDRDNTPECCGEPTVKQMDTPDIGAMSWTAHKAIRIPDGKGGDGKGTFIESGAQYKKFMRDNNQISHEEAVQESTKVKKEKAVKEKKDRREAVIKSFDQLAAKK